MTATFQTAGRIVTGRGSLGEIGSLAAGLGSRALLVTGRRALREAGVTEEIVQALAGEGLWAVVFDEVDPEPSVETVDAGRSAFRIDHCDLVIAAGGGSALDVGKAVAALGREVAPTAEFQGDRPVPAAGAACIAVPTTAGTGAEVTRNAVLTDPDRGVKRSIRGDALMPAVALVDSSLLTTCPADVIATAGMDALTQAVESYLSRHATNLTEALSLRAAESIWTHILAAYHDSADAEAADAMAEGSLLAGMALANARLGAVHGMAHAVGLRYGLRHGMVCAALLPAVLRFNRPEAEAKYEMLAEIFAADPADGAEGLLAAMGLPLRLGELGLARRDFPAIAAEALPSGSLKANPRPVSEADIHDILGQCL
jgi:alcohol dehydrogenase class IV